MHYRRTTSSTSSDSGAEPIVRAVGGLHFIQNLSSELTHSGGWYRIPIPVQESTHHRDTFKTRQARRDFVDLRKPIAIPAFSAITASPSARAHYDRRKADGDRHAAAQRNLFGRLLGCLHHCLAARTEYDETTAFPATGEKVPQAAWQPNRIGCLHRIRAVFGRFRRRP